MAEENIQEQPPKSSKTMLIVILVVVVNLVIIGVVVFFVLGKKDAPAEPAAAAAMIGPTGGPGMLMPMDNFVVNVRGQDGGKYLKASIVVELKSEGAVDAFNKWDKLLRNEVLVYLSSVEVEDTYTAKQKRVIEEKIKDIINDRIGTDLVTGAYFTEFVTQ